MAQWSATGFNLAGSYTHKRKSQVAKRSNRYKWKAPVDKHDKPKSYVLPHLTSGP